jgi:hypothetical protein
MKLLFVGEETSSTPQPLDGHKQAELALGFLAYFADDKSNEHSNLELARFGGELLNGHQGVQRF